MSSLSRPLNSCFLYPTASMMYLSFSESGSYLRFWVWKFIFLILFLVLAILVSLFICCLLDIVREFLLIANLLLVMDQPIVNIHNLLSQLVLVHLVQYFRQQHLIFLLKNLSLTVYTFDVFLDL